MNRRLAQSSNFAIPRHCSRVVGLLAFMAMLPLFGSAQRSAQTATVEVPPGYEVVSIKPSKPDDTSHDWDDTPGRLSIENYTLRQVVQSAYGLKSESQVVGGPKWIGSEHFDIVAKADDTETVAMRKMDRKQWVSARSFMLQSLLADRFKLTITKDTRDGPIYTLAIVRSGIKFAMSSLEEKNQGLSVRNGAMKATAVSMNSFADYLSTQPEMHGWIVENRTGLTGSYDFSMNWTRDRGNGVPSDANYPGLFTALREQLGLKLESQKGTVPIVVIDEAGEPTLDE